MKTKNYINGLAALLLCTACNNEELPQQDSQSDEIAFGAVLQTSTPIDARGIGNNSGQTEALPYIYGIHVRKMENPTPLNSNYKVKNGNKGTLEVENSSALKWTDNEKANTEIHFYAWTEPEGITISDGAATGTIDFGDISGNRAPRSQDEDDKHKMNDTYYTPLELFISAHTTGSYKDNPTISLPFTHQVAKVGIQIYNWNNERISNNANVTILFPFIKKQWNIEQKQAEGGNAFCVTTPCDKSDPLKLTMDNLHKVDNRRIFYLPPMVGDYDFAHAGDFVITYDSEKYYGTLNDLALTDKSLKAGEYMKCRIDLNKNYGTGVGAIIQDWKYAEETEAQANPYQGIYTLEGLKVLKSYLAGTSSLPDSLYIEGTETLDGKKIIRLYNDLTLTSDEECSLVLKDDMIFDGLGHTITVPETKSLFGEVSATKGNDISINNIRLKGAGQLAASLENVSVYNCHANGTANLVGTAKGTTKFDFCSAENSAKSITLMGSAEESNVTVTNSFVASSATKFVSGEGTITAQNSFVINNSDNTYWSTTATLGGTGTIFNINVNNVTATTVTISDVTTKLIDLLNTGSEGTGNQWVYVYGKNYPVMRIK